MKNIFLCAGVLGMAALLSGCPAAIIAGAAGAAVMADDPRSTGTQIDDETIESRAMSKLRERKDIISQSNLTVVSYNRIVLLLGQTPNATLKRDSGDIVANVPNVRKVYNEIKVAPPGGLWNNTTDGTLSARVKSALIADDGVPSNSVKVITEAGEVYLMGLVTRAHGDRATEIARGVGGVQKVIQLFEYTD